MTFCRSRAFRSSREAFVPFFFPFRFFFPLLFLLDLDFLFFPFFRSGELLLPDELEEEELDEGDGEDDELDDDDGDEVDFVRFLDLLADR